MKKYLFVVFAIAACNGPSPDLRGARMQEIDVDGAHFRVFVEGRQAEAVRTNVQWPANVRTVFPKAIIAMETVSGCSIDPRNVTGDAAMIRADLDCE